MQSVLISVDTYCKQMYNYLKKKKSNENYISLNYENVFLRKI